MRAWQLWAEHPHRQSLTNPVGNIILKLESGEPPPGEFLRAAEEQIRLREWMREQEERDAEGPEEEDPPEPEPESVPAEARRLWATSLGELQLQMTRATFDTWLRGSQVVEAGDGCLTIAVRHAYAVDWLQNRLLPVIQRTVARHAGGEIQDHVRRCHVVCPRLRTRRTKPTRPEGHGAALAIDTAPGLELRWALPAVPDAAL